MKRQTTHSKCAVAFASVCLIGGCAPRPDAPHVNEPSSTAFESENIFVPVRVKIHSLTRFVRHEAPGAIPYIDAHIELLDRWGLPVRALGELRFAVRFSPMVTRRIAQSDPGFKGKIAWSIDLTDPDRNASERYDRITHTYRIRLSDAALQLVGDEPFTLEASFIKPGIMVLPASALVDPAREPN